MKEFLKGPYAIYVIVEDENDALLLYRWVASFFYLLIQLITNQRLTFGWY